MKEQLQDFYNKQNKDLYSIRNFKNSLYQNIMKEIESFPDIKRDFKNSSDEIDNQIIYRDLNDEFDEPIMKCFYVILKKIIDIL